jgi:sugar/nucleoside kinase (ribokinase family)
MPLGRVLRRRLADGGRGRGLIRVVPGLPTGTAHVSYNSDGSRDFVFNMAGSAAARFPEGAEAVEAFVQAGVRVLHISGSPLGMRRCARALAVCEALHAGGVAISIDPNIRTELMADAGYLDGARTLIGMADYVLPSMPMPPCFGPGEAFADWAGSAARGAGGGAEAGRQGRDCLAMRAGCVAEVAGACGDGG